MQQLLNQAVTSSKLLPQAADELHLDKAVRVKDGSLVDWTAAIKPGEVAIQYEIGTVNDKPVFATLSVPSDELASLKGKLDKTLLPKEFTVGAVEIQSCAGERQCKRTCKDKDGNQYCCQYACK